MRSELSLGKWLVLLSRNNKSNLLDTGISRLYNFFYWSCICIRSMAKKRGWGTRRQKKEKETLKSEVTLMSSFESSSSCPDSAPLFALLSPCQPFSHWSSQLWNSLLLSYLLSFFPAGTFYYLCVDHLGESVSPGDLWVFLASGVDFLFVSLACLFREKKLKKRLSEYW